MAKSSKNEWFYLTLGHRRGPVAKEEIGQMIENQDIYIDSTKVWREGMPKWERLSNSKDFASIIKKLRIEASKADARARKNPNEEEIDEAIVCRGITRAAFNIFFYVGWLIPLAIGIVIITEAQVLQIVSKEKVERLLWIQLVPLFFSGLALWSFASSRMKHAGYTTTWGVTIFVPLMNLWTLLVCLCAPRNYGRKKGIGFAGLGYFLLFCIAITALVGGLIPGVKGEDAAPLAISNNLREQYEIHSDFRDRYNKKLRASGEAKAREAQRMRQKEAEMERKNKQMMDERGL